MVGEITNEGTLFLVMVLAIFGDILRVSAQCPGKFIDIDPDPPKKRCIASTVGTYRTLLKARLACQSLGQGLDPQLDVDLMTIGSTDVVGLMEEGLADVYWVGLTNVTTQTAPEWVSDCTPYDGRPFINESVACTGTDCFCFSYDGNTRRLLKRSCSFSHSAPALCAISRPGDFPEIICPANYRHITGRCYRFYNGVDPAVDFNGAEAICQADGGNLARVDQYGCYFAQIYDRAQDIAPNQEFLIGVRRVGGDLLWRDRTQAVVALHFGAGDCYALRAGDLSGLYRTQPCENTTMNFICEIDVPTQQLTTDTNFITPNHIPPSALSGTVLIVIVIVIALLLLALLVIVCVLRKRRTRKSAGRGTFENMHLADMSKKTEGQKRELDEMLRDKEVPHDRVSLEQKIGEGEFGVVHKGSVKITENGKTKEKIVAVKTTKVGAHYDAKDDLLDEMKLIAELGDHPNILNLVACCSTVEPFYLITEFMQHGDLLKFLRKCRETGDENLDPVYNVGEVEQLIIVRDIAMGMAHIQERRFYHGDLAARNVLIGDKLSVKISDFGLADDVYTRGYSKRGAEQKIPIKWCSMETILNGICSSQGDVWSFGVLLYEVFTLGGTPYPGVAPRFLVTQLKQGYRMEQPSGCPDDVYDQMRRCWQDDPNDRPRFSVIAEELAVMLMKRTDYVELDAMRDNNDELDAEHYARSLVTIASAKENLAPIDDADNEVDIEQLHSALNDGQELGEHA